MMSNLFKRLLDIKDNTEQLDRIEHNILVLDHNLSLLSDDLNKSKESRTWKSIPNHRFMTWQQIQQARFREAIEDIKKQKSEKEN
jgi:hypothetical protein